MKRNVLQTSLAVAEFVSKKICLCLTLFVILKGRKIEKSPVVGTKTRLKNSDLHFSQPFF